jgi:hypothetical protein
VSTLLKSVIFRVDFSVLLISAVLFIPVFYFGHEKHASFRVFDFKIGYKQDRPRQIQESHTENDHVDPARQGNHSALGSG